MKEAEAKAKKYRAQLRKWADTRERIYNSWKSGESFAAIGRDHGISRQRVYALVKRMKQG
jgi:hypothetical protein